MLAGIVIFKPISHSKVVKACSERTMLTKKSEIELGVKDFSEADFISASNS
jgi:hypothetical protein